MSSVPLNHLLKIGAEVLSTTAQTLSGAINELKAALGTKQDTLTFDNAPTASSDNPVKSGGIKDALDGKSNTGHSHTVSDITDFPVVDQIYDGASANAQSGVAVASAISSKADSSAIDEFLSTTTTVSNGTFSFTVDDTHGYGYKPYVVIDSSHNTNLKPHAELTSASGFGTSSLVLTYKTNADEGATVKMRVIK